MAFDTEGNGLHVDDGARVSVVSLAWRNPTGDVESLAVPWGQAGAPGVTEDDRGAWDDLLRVAATWRLVMHHAAHDCAVVQAGTILGWPGADLAPALYWDTLLVERILAPLERIGLEQSAIRRIGADPWKYQVDQAIPRETQTVVYKRLRGEHPWNQKGWATEAREEARRICAERAHQRSRFDLLPWPVIKPYATDDAVNTLLLQEAQEHDLQELSEGERESAMRKVRLCRVLIRMERTGVGFDVKGANRAADILQQLADEAVLQLLPEMLPPTPHNLRRFYYSERGYQPTKWDPKAERFVQSVDDYSRQGLKDQGAPKIDELNEWIDLDRALSMWYKPWPANAGDDGRLRMRIRQAKVTSGRFSGERINLLAIPHETPRPDVVTPIRSLIVAKPGFRLVEVDLSQAEPRIGSKAANCTPLLEEYAKGKGADVYAKSSLELFDQAPCPQHGRGHKGCPECKVFERWRDLCKRLVLSSIYATGAATFVFQVKKFMHEDMSEDDGRTFLGIFREQYPQFKRAERYYKRYVEDHGYVPLALGARRYFQTYEQSYKGFNQRVQGSVAVGMEVLMPLVEEKHPGAMLVQTYDSLLLEVEADDDETPGSVGALMEDTFATIFKVPFIADVKEWNK